MTEVSNNSQPNNNSLIVNSSVNRNSEVSREEYGDQLPNVEQLLAERPGASREDVLHQAERQLRLAIEANLGKELGIPSEFLRTFSLDQMRDTLARAVGGIDSLRTFAKGASRDAIKELTKPRPMTAIESRPGTEPTKKKTAKKEKKPPRRERNRAERNNAKDIIRSEMADMRELQEERSARKGLFSPDSRPSNEFIQLGEESFSPFDFYGTYLGSEVRALEENTRVSQLGDDKSIPERLIPLKKEKELAGSFVTSAPMSFFRTMLKAMKLEDIIPKFEEARKNLLTTRYRELKDSFKNSTSSDDINWKTILDKFNRELELKQEAIRKPDRANRLRTRGISSSFLSRVRSIWKDPLGLVLEKSLAV